jgi:hypothetical protein
MNKRVLLVTADNSLLHELGGALRAQNDISVMDYPDEIRGLQQLTDFGPDFVIVSLALARDSQSPILDYGGLSFCKGVIAISSAPIALVTPSPVPDAVLDRLGTLGRSVYCNPIKDGYVAKVLDQIRTAKPPAKRLDIVIEGDAANRWTYALRGENFQHTFDRKGTLNFDLGAQDLCKTLAGVIGKGAPDWEDTFTQLGKGIVRSLFGEESSFEKEVKQGVQEAGGLHNTRVTFSVGKEQYEIALEAVFPPGNIARHPWMIHAPLVRNVREQVAANTPLFDGPPRLKRCLIVGANTSGFCDDIVVGGSSLVLGELSHVKSECDAVEALFKESQRDIGFADPKVVGTDPGKPLNRDDFLDLLTDPWDVIHFAGHAYHSMTPANGAPATTEHACLFVGEPGHPQAVEMNTIAPSLRETTSLLYLSGCKTANAGFAIAAAQYGVPAVLGFRWKVLDKPAEQHARLFYHQLFRARAIDKAFRNTRRGMRLLARKDNAWASGMLVMAKH